jgi:hypothetical protein
MITWDATPSHEYVTLLKLHGACNILTKVNSIYEKNVVYAGRFGYHGFAGGSVGKLYLAGSQSEIERWCNDPRNGEFSPVIAQYVREKSFLNNAAAFFEMQQFWARKVANAKTVILIGVRLVPQDEHIWSPLFKSEADLLVVDPSFETFEVWGKNRVRQPRHLAKHFSDYSVIQQEIFNSLSS